MVSLFQTPIMSFEWSEKENKYTMFTEDEKEDKLKKIGPGREKEIKRGDQLCGILNKEKNTTEQTNLKIKKKTK